MNLGKLIQELEAMPSEGVVSFGFARPMSYRGYYNCLAFEPAVDVTIGSMLEYARSANGAVYEGYKGGDYRMDTETDCYIADYGEYGEDQISTPLIAYWSKEASV